ncbi:Glutarate-semialdehyde dehydrogenase DavD [Nymphon striatum]|nr:Glutarate-semialdehyde dehydrogenase DavD [Nymphon striatum]
MDANAAGPGGLVAPKIWRDKPVGELAPAHAVLDVIEEEDLCARAMNFVRAAQRLERSVPQRPELSQSVPRPNAEMANLWLKQGESCMAHPIIEWFARGKRQKRIYCDVIPGHQPDKRIVF